MGSNVGTPRPSPALAAPRSSSSAPPVEDSPADLRNRQMLRPSRQTRTFKTSWALYRAGQPFATWLHPGPVRDLDEAKATMVETLLPFADTLGNLTDPVLIETFVTPMNLQWLKGSSCTTCTAAAAACCCCRFLPPPLPLAPLALLPLACWGCCLLVWVLGVTASLTTRHRGVCAVLVVVGVLALCVVWVLGWALPRPGQARGA